MFITIGQIVNTHGNQGEVKVLPMTDDPGRFQELALLYAVKSEAASSEAERRQLTPTGVRFHKNMVLVIFKEVTDMNQAEALKGYYLQLPEAKLKPLPEGRHYIYQLIGLSVYEGETCYGTLMEVLQPGSNDVYVVRDGNQEILIPALKDVIRTVDLVNRRMEVVLPAGLLD